jgi:murein DD-endopeptidase MepM/ murein hydrolase activator NlpD
MLEILLAALLLASPALPKEDLPPITACRPVPGPVVGHIGEPRPGGRSHGGTDYEGERGQVVYAAFAGRVTDIRYEGWGGGIVVELRHPDGSRTKYMHMFDATMAWRIPIDELPLPVKVGDWVRACDPIGYVGNSGLARIYHLHFSYVPPHGWNINPETIVWDAVPPVAIYPYWLGDSGEIRTSGPHRMKVPLYR